MNGRGGGSRCRCLAAAVLPTAVLPVAALPVAAARAGAASAVVVRTSAVPASGRYGG
ncbi:hypothetical protein [Frankia sp. Cj3]|uniref:hypothetical protein n=1 Tax=Frankia sp. Cj3 TaxID=2880976 RepID=UPI001EF721E7|nr:hypothetical protein [Frankia sp. Cj3]